MHFILHDLFSIGFKGENSTHPKAFSHHCTRQYAQQEKLKYGGSWMRKMRQLTTTLSDLALRANMRCISGNKFDWLCLLPLQKVCRIRFFVLSNLAVQMWRHIQFLDVNLISQGWIAVNDHNCSQWLTYHYFFKRLIKMIETINLVAQNVGKHCNGQIKK